MEDSVCDATPATVASAPRILERLLELARERRYHAVMARVTAENVASLRLHERRGFRVIGVERETAFKVGRWLDTAIMQRLLDG